jgi:FAD-dependent sensor of blue light
MAPSHLHRIAYTSALRHELPPGELQAMLSTWRRRNAERAVTGLFLYDHESVFQVLEGFPDVIDALYETISQDRRHHFVTKLIDEPIAERSFGDWSVGHARIPRPQLGAPEPLRALLDPAFRYWHCDEAMARALVAGFATGPWHRSIS